MKLMISNDDGVYAAGIRALATELSRHHEIFVSAPDRERSAVSRAMTLNEPLRAHKTRIEGLPDVPAFAISGRPASKTVIKIFFIIHTFYLNIYNTKSRDFGVGH